MAISPGQLNAIEIVERVSSALSLVGTLFIIGTFLFNHEYRKPPNRLIFHAAWGNIMSCITCTIAMEGPRRGEDSALCQAQGFFMQWFMWTDTFWGLCFAINVWLTVFHRFSHSRLQKLEWTYVAACYGLPGILAIIFLFIHTEAKGKLYGSLLIWCWIRDSWDIVRIVAFYIPVWLAILATTAIFAITWREMLSTGKALRAGLTTHNTELQSTVARDPSETEFQSTRPDPSIIGDDSQPLTQTSNDSENAPHKKMFKSTVSSTQEPPQGLAHTRQLKLKIDGATWAYAVYAMIYFVALLITWVPPSITRVYAMVYTPEPHFVLNLLTALVLPLQGLWNAVIYVHVSRKTVQRQLRELWRTFVGSGHASI